jgi:hypothetical protein
MTLPNPFGTIHQTAKHVADVAAVFTIASIPLAALRIYSTSGFDRNTALAITTYTSLSVFAVAIFVTITQSIFAAAAILLLLYVGGVFRPKSISWWIRLLAGTALAIIVLFSAETLRGFIVYLVLLSMAPFVPLVYRKMFRAVLPLDMRFFAFLALAMQLIFVATSRSLWLPAERVLIAGEPRTVYVLRERDEQLAVFYDDDHIVAWLDKSSITERQFCSLEQSSPLKARVKKDRPLCP